MEFTYVDVCSFKHFAPYCKDKRKKRSRKSSTYDRPLHNSLADVTLGRQPTSIRRTWCNTAAHVHSDMCTENSVFGTAQKRLWESQGTAVKGKNTARWHRNAWRERTLKQKEKSFSLSKESMRTAFFSGAFLDPLRHDNGGRKKKQIEQLTYWHNAMSREQFWVNLTDCLR